MNKEKTPCYGCLERSAECHGRCERYAQYRKECERLKALRVAEIKKDEDFHGVKNIARKIAINKNKKRR